MLDVIVLEHIDGRFILIFPSEYLLYSTETGIPKEEHFQSLKQIKERENALKSKGFLPIGEKMTCAVKLIQYVLEKWTKEERCKKGARESDSCT